MANSFSFNSTDLGGANYGLTVLENSFPFLAQPNIDVRIVAQQFGGVSRFGSFGTLVIPIRCVVTGSTAADLWTKMDAIRTILDPQLGEKNLQLDWITDRYWKALLGSSIEAGISGVYHKEFDMRFVASDSRAYSTTTRSSPDFTITTTPQTLTVESGPTAVVGTADADCVWVIKNTSGSTVTSLILNNTTKTQNVTRTNSPL